MVVTDLHSQAPVILSGVRASQMRSHYAVEGPLYPHSSTSEIRRGKGRRRSIT